MRVDNGFDIVRQNVGVERRGGDVQGAIDSVHPRAGQGFDVRAGVVRESENKASWVQTRVILRYSGSGGHGEATPGLHGFRCTGEGRNVRRRDARRCREQRTNKKAVTRGHAEVRAPVEMPTGTVRRGQVHEKVAALAHVE